jgi:hypothetical protein
LTGRRADAMLSGVENACHGCGERATRMTYPTSGPAAGRWLCRDCASGRKKMTRLSRLVAFRFRVAEVLPPDDPTIGPALWLMMAVDDVRRAQIHFVEAIERVDEPGEKHRARGDFLYSLRLLFSHLHEAGHALRRLDGWAARGAGGKNRVDDLLGDEEHREGMSALKELRRFFSAQGYWASLIPRVRNAIGSHYDERVVAELLAAAGADATADATAASVGGLARMADTAVSAIVNGLNGGDLMADETKTRQVSQALGVCGHLIKFVDHLFDALLRAHPDAIVERDTRIVDVPPLVARASEAMAATRERLRDDSPAARSGVSTC